MGAAALSLLYSLYFKSAAVKWKNVSEQVKVSDVRHIRGTGGPVLLVFSDYECPACAAFERDVYPEIERSLISPGKVHFAMLNFPLTSIHPLAAKAAEASECADNQRKYWDMRRRLFDISPALAMENLMATAWEVGVDVSPFTACLTGQQKATVAADAALGRRFGLTGTPSFFLGQIEGDSVRFSRAFSGVPSASSISSEVAKMERRKHFPWSLFAVVVSAAD
jgi:protein-disulfide isomerase